MTIDEFLAKLAQTPRTWFLSETGCIRSGNDCPLTAATGGRYHPGNFEAAGEALGLQQHESCRIAAAADDDVSVDEWNSDGEVDYALRQRLLEACGLTAQAAEAD